MPTTNGKIILPNDSTASQAASEFTAIYVTPPDGMPASASSAIRITNLDGHLKQLEEIEGEMIRIAIEKYDGHMSEVARRLGIGRSTLYRKVRDLGLEPQSEPE